VKNKGCSQRLQRAVCDFGIDCSFEQASKKLKEHYCIELCTETIRKITQQHAKRAKEFNKNNNVIFADFAKQLVVESDGSMVPLVEILEGEGDCRKRRRLFWKEFRLAAIQKFGKADWLYAISNGSIEDLEEGLKNISVKVGFNHKTKVHSIGDGALWVQELMDTIFGCQSKYLIDFFHLCEYLASASEVLGNDKKEWMKKTKDLIKKGGIDVIVIDLKNHLEKNPGHEGLINCIRYINNRKGQFAYDEAIAKKLPIGSGKIESSHRNIIQQRMKKPGAWWKKESAEDMINLRILRAHGDWEVFWEEETKKRIAA
jgi:hypothetical protein